MVKIPFGVNGKTRECISSANCSRIQDGSKLYFLLIRHIATMKRVCQSIISLQPIMVTTLWWMISHSSYLAYLLLLTKVRWHVVLLIQKLLLLQLSFDWTIAISMLVRMDICIIRFTMNRMTKMAMTKQMVLQSSLQVKLRTITNPTCLLHILNIMIMALYIYLLPPSIPRKSMLRYKHRELIRLGLFPNCWT